MKKYVIMVHFSDRGWRVLEETDSFKEALLIRESWLVMGTSSIRLLKSVEVTVDITVTENESKP